MWKKISVLLTASMLITFSHNLFAAEVDLIDASFPMSILDTARGYGQANLEKDNEGDPKISGKIEGVKYAIYFYGCNKNENCKDIQFSASWSGAEKTQLSTINQFNTKRRYGKVYLTEKGSLFIEMTVDMQYGTTISNLESWFERWKTALALFDKEVLQAP